MNPHRLKAYILLLIVTLIWGAASVVIKLTLEGIDPLPFLSYRFLISALISLFYLKQIKNIFSEPKGVIFSVLAYSVLSTTIALGFLFLGLDVTTVLNLSLITLAAPLLTEFAGVYFLSEKLTKREKVGSLIAFFGTILTVVEPVIQEGINMGSLYGNFMILLYLLADVSSVIILKKLLRNKIDPIGLANFSFVVGFITILPFTLFQMKGLIPLLESVKNISLFTHAGVWYMAVFSGTVAYALRNKAQKTIEVGEAALFAYLTSLASVPLAVVILKEKITLLYVIGAFIILAGVVIAEYKKKGK